MKKTWIKIKRGLLRPEHRERLGVRVWLFMYMLDRADWDTGRIYGWKDKDEAEDFDMSWRTLQKHRQEIEELGYITCIKRKYSQEIVIHKWTNPREYSGDEYNIAVESTLESTQKRVPSEIESTLESTHHLRSKVGTPTLYSQITDHINIKDIRKNGGVSKYLCDLVDSPEIDSRTEKAIAQAATRFGDEDLCHIAYKIREEFPAIKLQALMQRISKYGPTYL